MRGFKLVKTQHRKCNKVGKIPTRGDKRSAGYDFYSPLNVVVPPLSIVIIWTNVKAYMAEDEVLELYVRSSVGIKSKLMLANSVGVIDSSYFENVDNDGNIGIALYNYGDAPVKIAKGDRVAQGVFQKYLIADEDIVLNAERTGGTGSTGK